MYKFKIFFLFLFLVKSVSAQDNQWLPLKNIDSFKKNVNYASQTTTTIESDFVQKKHLSFVEEDIISKGKFYYEKEGKVRWEYEIPFKYLIVINDGKVMIKDDEKKEKFDQKNNKVFKEINSMMMACVHGNIMNSKEFEIKFFENEKIYKLNLIPNAPKLKEFITSIEIYFNKTDYSVEKFTLKEISDDYTTITFSNKKLNMPIVADKFILN